MNFIMSTGMHKNKEPVVNSRTAGYIAKQQKGAVLVVSLIMLLIMTLIGLSSMRTTILEEKMAGNYRDRNIAFQAAEAALLDAEADVVCNGCTRASPISGLDNFDATCTGGTCGGWVSTVWTDTSKMGNVVTFGTYTGATAIAGVATAPNYLIEGKKCIAPGWASYKYCYQITATGYGGSANATSVLQEVYIKP